MKVEFLEIELKWPPTVCLKDLRSLVLNQINSYGIPLRWAITDVASLTSGELTRIIRVEVVLIKN